MHVKSAERYIDRQEVISVSVGRDAAFVIGIGGKRQNTYALFADKHFRTGIIANIALKSACAKPIDDERGTVKGGAGRRVWNWFHGVPALCVASCSMPHQH